MGVSLNGGTLITHPKCWSLLVGKSMVVGETHHFRGNPHMHWYKQLTSGPSIHLARWNGSRKRWMEENSLIARYIKDRALPWQLGCIFFWPNILRGLCGDEIRDLFVFVFLGICFHQPYRCIGPLWNFSSNWRWVARQVFNKFELPGMCRKGTDRINGDRVTGWNNPIINRDILGLPTIYYLAAWQVSNIWATWFFGVSWSSWPTFWLFFS